MKMLKPKSQGQTDILLIGELNPDIIITELQGPPKPGREIIANNARLSLGSSTAICACQISKLGLTVQLLSKVGKDDFGRYCVDFLKKNKVGTSGIKYDASIGTGLTVSLALDNDRAFVTYLGTTENFTYQDVDLKYFKTAKHLHMSSFFLLKKLRPDFAPLFKEAKKNGLTTSLDTGWDPDEKWGEDLFKVLENTDIFLPNKDELLQISGEKDISEGLRKLAKIVPVVVCKMGGDGAILRSGETVISMPAFSVNVKDTTGAGDSFNAGFISAFISGEDLKDCLRLGNACGALSASAIGGTSGFDCLEDVETFIQTNSKK